MRNTMRHGLVVGGRLGSRVAGRELENAIERTALLLALALFVSCADTSDSAPGAAPDSGMNAPEARQAAPPNTLTEAERAAGWQLLFDGETTEGWRGYNRESFPTPGGP